MMYANPLKQSADLSYHDIAQQRNQRARDLGRVKGAAIIIFAVNNQLNIIHV